jgi:PE family
MSVISVVPAAVSDAASTISSIGSTISDANSAASFPTTSVLPAAADEVSAQIAALFGAHGQQFQAVSAQAASSQQRMPTTISSMTIMWAGAQ